MSSLNIVPVSITYEYDPNDLAKANELYEKKRMVSIIKMSLRTLIQSPEVFAVIKVM